MDWSEGEYERTAETLQEASVAAIAAAKITNGARVLDLGTGTGNAAIVAARAGGDVVAVDPSERLVGVCRSRAEREELAIDARVGDAGAIPTDDRTFDAIVSVFAVIFAPDADRAVDEMLRVAKPGARIVVTTWTPRGAISKVSAILRGAMAEVDPGGGARQAFAWGDPGFAREIFERRGATVTVEERSLAFTAPSPEAWFDDQATHHPIWRGIKSALTSIEGAWDRVRARSLEALRDGNEDPAAFRTTSTYLLVTAVPR